MEIYRQRRLGIVPLTRKEQISPTYNERTRFHSPLRGRSAFQDVSIIVENGVPSLVVRTYDRNTNTYHESAKKRNRKKRTTVGKNINEFGEGTRVRGRLGTTVVYTAR